MDPVPLPARSNRTRSSKWARLLVWLWVPATMLPTAYLMGWHLLTLPVPRLGVAVENKMKQFSPIAQWRVLHVLAQKCACSARVLDHLLTRGAKDGYAESILLIGDNRSLATQALSRGFAFENISSETLKQKYGIEGAPLLVVMSPAGTIRYSGGYSASKQGPIEDVAIFADLAQGKASTRRPLFGCAVSKELQRKIDPLGIKYAQESR